MGRWALLSASPFQFPAISVPEPQTCTRYSIKMLRCSTLKGSASLQDSQWSGKQRKKEQSYWKGGVQKTGGLILGEQRYGYTMVHYKLFLYEERTSHPSNSKAQGNTSPYTKESEFKMQKHLINWNQTSRCCCPLWSKTYVKRYSEHIISISLN